MHLICPSCESRFLIDTAALGPSGRRVRCGRCGHSWLAEAEAGDGAADPKPERRSGAEGWIVYALVVVALVAGIVFGRQQIMAWVPETAGLYALVGIAAETSEMPLELQGDWRLVDGERTLMIEGRIVNPSDRPREVPPLVATLIGPEGAELKRWTFSADVEVVPPGGSVAFHTSTDDPPSQGNLNLSFAPAGG